MSEAMKREWDAWLEEYREISSADHIPLELSNKLNSLLLQCVEKGYADVLKEAYEKIPLARRATIADLRRTALHLAVDSCETVVVERMLESVDPKDLLIQDENGQTALHLAILKRKPKSICKLMIERASEDDLLLQDNNGNTVLHLAIHKNAPELCRRMLEISPRLGNTQNENGDTPLILAAYNDWEGLCIHMFERSCVENSHIFVQNLDKDTAFHVAVRKRLRKLCKLLIERASADDLLLQDNNGATVLHLAIGQKEQELCKRMLEISPRLGNTKNKKGDTPLILATYNDWEDLCIHMIERSYVENSLIFVQNLNGDTAFHFAAAKGMRMLCKLLIERDSEDDHLRRDGDGNTFLHLALYNGHFEMVHQMLQFNLQVNPFLGTMTNLEGEKPVHILVKKASPVISSRAQLGHIDSLIYSCIPDADLRRAWYDDGDSCKEESKMWLKIMHKISWRENRQPRDEENPPSTSTMHNALDNDEGVQKQESWLRKMFYKFLALTLVKRVEKIRNKKQQYLLICDLVYKLASLEVSPLVIVAEFGLTEVVKKIMNENPEAIHQRRYSDGKNAVLLAAENRSFDVYELLLHHCRKNKIQLNVFGSTDILRNNALHLVAKFNPNRRPWGMPGSSMQMHWEMKWYKYVRDSIPNKLWTAVNGERCTPAELFKKAHGDLYQSNGKGEWVSMTSQACSVVAGLIATVAFSSATTIPGSNSEKGYPNFRGRPALSTFVIFSFIALCFSLISLIIFLSILISPFDDVNDDLSDDNSKSLPKELMGGLTTLFLSIVAMLVSFCAGHYFYLKGTILFLSIPVYLIGCLIIASFFFKKVYSIFLFYAITRKPEPWYEIPK